MPREQATAGDPVARVAAYGIPAERVDGMDVRAVREAAIAAVARARIGSGPSFLHCHAYRFFGHHTAEATMQLRYRSEDEIAAWRKRDPLLVEGARLDLAAVAAIDAEVEVLLDAALETARAGERPDAADAFAYMYADGLEPRAGVA
jgi:pyruvate dehydrogenase E1 component alpha subunit